MWIIGSLGLGVGGNHEKARILSKGLKEGNNVDWHKNKIVIVVGLLESSDLSPVLLCVTRFMEIH